MGNEALCQAEFSGQPQTGKALLETTELIFRPSDGSKSVKIPFSTIKSAKAQNGELQLHTVNGPILFNLGPTAEKWCHKILHPKTRSEKLGLKPGVNVSLLGSFDHEFLKELRDTKAILHKGKINAASDLIFLSTNSTKDLTSAVSKASKSIKGPTALWIVYPKGKKEITENDVLSKGRKSGLKDVKVVGFSPTHTALKFVLPLDRR
jgi:hypothetical protein